ncbi:MAG: cytochrome P450 [Solirubrobacteraceae bacterium]
MARELPRESRIRSAFGAVQYLVDPLSNLRSFARRAEPIVRTSFPGIGPMVYVSDPDLVKQVFTGDPAVYHAGESTAAFLGPVVGPNSVLTLDEQPHLRQRKLLLPPFHGANIDRWAERIREITERDIATWPVGSPFSLRTRTQRITLEVILRAVFGVRGKQRFERVLPLVDDFARRANLIVLFPILRRDLGRRCPWMRFQRSRAALDAFLYEEIALRRTEADLAERDDVLSLLLQATDDEGRPMTDHELRDELITVIGAGHETTATAVAWAFERLLRTPAVLDRLKRSLPDGDEYLEATIKETLRMRPVIVDVGRRLTRDIELGGYLIPAGSLLVPSIAGIHYREDAYPQANEFRPERFLNGASDSYVWIPFGGGVRRCIGASFAQFEMRLMIRTILERADLRAARPAPERAKIRNITIAPARGCQVVLERRLAEAGAQAAPDLLTSGARV